MNIQLNSVYVNNGMTVVTLFFSKERNSMWYAVDDIAAGSNTCEELCIEVAPELATEMIDHSERVWGCSPQLYYLKRFRSYLSFQLWDFIEECWEAIKRQEPELFPAKDENK